MESAAETPKWQFRRSAKRGMLLQPLVFRPNPSPIAGESFRGSIARCTERNGFFKLRKVYSLADLRSPSLRDIGEFRNGEVDRIAYLIKVPREEVDTRIHRRVVRSDIDGNFVDFFGSQLRAWYLEASRRRVSPRALAISPHHRAIHDLRPLSFCPEVLEMLIDSCPVCCKPLQWIRTKGAAFCEHCVDEDDNPRVDLRDFPQPLVQVKDEAALRFVTDLVNPISDLRAKALRNADPRFAEFGTGDLFELAILLARAVGTPPTAHPRSLRSLRRRSEFADLAPDLLATAGRAIMDWGAGFRGLVDAMRAQAVMRRGSGVAKEFGALSGVIHQKTLPKGIRALIKQSIGLSAGRTVRSPPPTRRVTRYGPDMISSTDAARLLCVTRRQVCRLAKRKDIDVVRSEKRGTPVLFRAEQIATIRNVRVDMIEESKAARLIGVPPCALEKLAESGMIRRVEGPALALMADGTFYRQSSINDLQLSIFRQCQSTAARSKNWSRLDGALCRLPPGAKPWSTIVRALRNGTLPAVAGRQTGSLFARLFVPYEQLATLVTSAKGEQYSPCATFSYREAAAIIGIRQPVISSLVAVGLIQTSSKRERCITMAALARFDKEYATSREVAYSLGVHPSQVRNVLSKQGIEPVYLPGVPARVVWRRSDVFD